MWGWLDRFCRVGETREFEPNATNRRGVEEVDFLGAASNSEVTGRLFVFFSGVDSISVSIVDWREREWTRMLIDAQILQKCAGMQELREGQSQHYHLHKNPRLNLYWSKTHCGCQNSREVSHWISYTVFRWEFAGKNRCLTRSGRAKQRMRMTS